MSNALVVAGYTPVTVLVVLACWRYGDHSWVGILHWTSFYCVGVVLPYIWARRALQQLERLGPAARPLAVTVGYYIVASGALTLLVGLGFAWKR